MVGDKLDYAKKSDIPSTAGLATEKYVDDAVKNVEVDLTDYPQKKDLATVATSGDYNDLINAPDATINVGGEPGGDIWIDTSEGDAIDFADVAFTGSYNNLIDTPDLSIYMTEEMVVEMIEAALPPSGEEVRY